MTYKESIKAAMEELAKDDRVVFLGYNTRFGGRAGGALADVPEEKLIEMPLAENLMAGVAIGLSLEGQIPVLYFERFDFVVHALDAIVNHLDKLATLSEGLHKPAVIIRVVVGNKLKPLYTGITHTQDFSDAMRCMVSFPVYGPKSPANVLSFYKEALESASCGISTMLVEYKDLL